MELEWGQDGQEEDQSYEMEKCKHQPDKEWR